MTAAVPVPPVRRSSRRRIALAAGIVAVLAVAAVFFWLHAHRKGVTFTALFSSSVGVYPGSDVRMLGVPVGSVDSVTPRGKLVELRMHLDPDRAAAADTAAVIVSPNLVSDRYVQLTLPWVTGPKLRANQRILQTRTPVELDDLYRSLLSLSDSLGPKGANSDGALTRLVDTGAANLGGNGKALNTMLTELAGASRTLSSSKDGIFNTIDNLRTFTSVLEKNNSGLTSVNTNLAAVSQTFANDRQSFAEAMKELGSALSLIQTFVHDNRAALTSNVAKLGTVASTIAGQRASLLKALAAAPLLVQNFIRAYDPEHNLLRGRANLNELTVWARQQSAKAASSGTATSGSATSGTAASGGVTSGTATGAPAGLLPASNVASGGGR